MKITAPQSSTSLASGGSSSGGGGSISGPAGGDLSGTFPGPTVSGLQGTPICITAPALNDVLQFDGTEWCPSAVTSTGFVLTHDGGEEEITAHGNTGTTETFFSSGTGNVHTATLNANCTFTFASVTSGKACSFTMLLTQDGTGSRLVTWPGSVIWQGGTAPTLATAAGSVDVLTFFTLDGGSVWYGFHAGSGGASFATPAIVLGTAAAAGAATTTIRSDSTIVAFDTTVPGTQAFGDTAATGSVAFAARRDHKHGMPANPVSLSAISALGFVGPILMTDGITSPPEPMWTEDGTDYIYQDL